MRDHFPKPVVETLAKRVGNRCSNPDCRKCTSGPHTEESKAVNVGAAAHITAASPGGPRYDRSLTSDERSAIGNGIWLCQNCAKLVDNDEEKYPKALLRRWKEDAEQEANRQVESSGPREQANEIMKELKEIREALKRRLTPEEQADVDLLVEGFFNAKVDSDYTASRYAAWLHELDPEDARWIFLRAKHDIGLLKTWNVMEAAGVMVTESEEREISNYVGAIDVGRLETAFRETAEICGIPDELTKADLNDLLSIKRENPPTSMPL